MPTTRPTDRLRKIVDAYPSVNAAARAFGVEYMTLARFLKTKGGGSLSADALASIMDATKLPYNELFVYGDEEEAKQ